MLYLETLYAESQNASTIAVFLYLEFENLPTLSKGLATNITTIRAVDICQHPLPYSPCYTGVSPPTPTQVLTQYAFSASSLYLTNGLEFQFVAYTQATIFEITY
jgi:hypothetical protein